MRKFIYSVLILLFISSSLFGQTKAVINGSSDDTGVTRSAVGDLVVLDATTSQGEEFGWYLLNSKKTFLVSESKRKIAFASGTTGSYSFVLVVTGPDNNGKQSNKILFHTVLIGEDPIPGPSPVPVPIPNPTPNPTPNPVPNPTPVVVPDDQFNNLGKSIVEWSNTYLKADGKTISSKIGDNYKKIAIDLNNGDVLLKDSFIKVAELNKSLYSTQPVHDQYILVGSRINEVYTKLSSTFDRDVMVEFLNVIGDSFKAVK